MWQLIFAQAAPAAAPAGGVQQPGLMEVIGQMAPLFAVFGVAMYFMVIRPQSQRDKERRDMMATMAKGDSVVTKGGICGTIVGISDSHVVLRVDDNCKIEFVREAISHKVKAADAK